MCSLLKHTELTDVVLTGTFTFTISTSSSSIYSFFLFFEQIKNRLIRDGAERISNIQEEEMDLAFDLFSIFINDCTNNKVMFSATIERSNTFLEGVQQLVLQDRALELIE